MPYFRTASAVCGPCSACANYTPRRCSRKRSRLPSAALSSSMNCAMNIPRKSYPPGSLPRIISKQRTEPPDIDVDFEHERREEVIQYIYGKYGRERAALAATVICYRPRSALRDVGKALGLDLGPGDKPGPGMHWWDGQRIDPDRIRASGFDPEDPVIARLIALAAEILGFPRHLSQPVGGFVMARGRLDELVPIENAAMPDRTVIEWDKDDLDALGLLKVDVLGLGMLSAIRRAFRLINEFGGLGKVTGKLDLAAVPGEVQ